MAVAFEGYDDEQLKNDPNYVRYIFHITGKKDNKWYERLISHHVCTNEDYEKFYPMQKIQESTLENYKDP